MRQLQILRYRKVLSSWVPHELRDSDKACRISIAESLLLRAHRKDFHKDIVTGDESSVLYVNHNRKSQRGEPAGFKAAESWTTRKESSSVLLVALRRDGSLGIAE